MRRLTDEEKQFVVRAIEDWEADIDKETLHALLQTPEGLHIYAQRYNWDDGPAEMLKVIRNPNCDLGTAILVYWYGGAGFYCQYADRTEVPEYELAYYDLLREIEARVSTGFYQHQSIRFDPRSDDGDDWTQSYADVIEARREIPAQMYGPTPGEPLKVKAE